MNVGKVTEIQAFLEGYNNDLKYLVNVEVLNNTNIAECIIHEPNCEPKIVKVSFESFIYMKDLSLTNHKLYGDKSNEWLVSKQIKHGITITKLKTGNQKRLVNGYCYKITSSKSHDNIIEYLRDGGLNPYEKLRDSDGTIIKEKNGNPIYLYRDLFHSPRLVEQFFISTQSRLFKGFEDYNDTHRVIFDIETTGLRYQISRIFAIGVRDNRGFEIILEVDRENDDVSEIKLIEDFFKTIHQLKPAIICGFNSEDFDFDFILGRAKILNINFDTLPTGLINNSTLKRKPNTSVKYGNTADRYTATEMWGYSIIDILHAAKRTAAINSDIKENKLKYLAKYEGIAKKDRVYINGDDNSISKKYWENKYYLIGDNGGWILIPLEYQNIANKLYLHQKNKNIIPNAEYLKIRNEFISEDKSFIKWFKDEALPNNMINFINGKGLIKRYLLDDLWETEQIDVLYNQSSFLLAKLVPTTYQRICTMGTAAIWNLLLTAWSYDNDLAIPIPDNKEQFSGGLARCFKSGYSKRIMKIDFASLYPMIQLEDDVFPIFDITGVIKKMLLYLTTTRNIYKKLATTKELNANEIQLFESIDRDAHDKYVNSAISNDDKNKFKVKQLPIKILNNSLFGALGSDISFNWSDNLCAARITCTGRLHLRHAISWFSDFGLVPLLAVTDGINFQIPDTTTIRVTDGGIFYNQPSGTYDEMCSYGGETGVSALIKLFNATEMRTPYMSIDNDGESVSCLNLSRINYATLTMVIDKKSGEVREKMKLTGNTIKSKVMPEYIQEFIDKGLLLILQGKGKEFVDYYYDYVEKIYYKQIPLKKIASKSKVKLTIKEYLKRGKDKNGREKGIQAHMELLIEQRNIIAEKLFDHHKHELGIDLNMEYTIDDKLNYVANYMPQEPELDSTVYYVNTGYVKSHGDSKLIKDKNGGELRFASSLISSQDLLNNPSMKGDYNVAKYLDAFNSRVETILVGFDSEVRDKIIVKINKNGDLIKNEFTSKELTLQNFNLDDFDEAMHIEPKEVIFWNKYGYDPRRIWSGFKMYDDDKIYYEIYDNALKYLNDILLEKNKPLIKSINDVICKNDMVLIKDGGVYHIGLHNGTYIRIIKEHVTIPKSQIEIELENKEKLINNKIENLRKSDLGEISQYNKIYDGDLLLRNKLFNDFRKQFNLSQFLTYDLALEQWGGEFTEMFNQYVDMVNIYESNMVDVDDVIDSI